MLGAGRPPRALPALVAAAGRGIFSRLELVVRPNIESYTVRLPEFRSHGWASSPRAPALLRGGECNDGPQQLQDHCANPVPLFACAHARAYISCVLSPFVDTDRASQANFGHKPFFLRHIQLAIAAITGRPLNPLGLRPIARKFNLGLVSLLLALMLELK